MTISVIPRSASQGHRAEDIQLERDLFFIADALGCSRSELIRLACKAHIEKILKENDDVKQRFELQRRFDKRMEKKA